jgi:chromosome segregation ATPase
VLEKVRLQEEVEKVTEQYNHLKELLLDQDEDVKRLTEQLTECEEQFQEADDARVKAEKDKAASAAIARSATRERARLESENVALAKRLGDMEAEVKSSLDTAMTSHI